MELEKKQAETNYQQLSHDVTKRQHASSPSVEPVLPTTSQPGSNSRNREGDISSHAIYSRVITRFVVSIGFLWTQTIPWSCNLWRLDVGFSRSSSTTWGRWLKMATMTERPSWTNRYFIGLRTKTNSIYKPSFKTRLLNTKLLLIGNKVNEMSFMSLI